MTINSSPRAYWCTTHLQTSIRWSFLCYSTSLYIGHDIPWPKIFLCPVQVSCHGCAPSQLLVHFSLTELGACLPGWCSCVQITKHWRVLRFLLWWYSLWFGVRSVMRRNYRFLANLKVDFYSCINKFVCHSPSILFIFTILVELAEKNRAIYITVISVEQK